MATEWYYTTNKQQMGPVSWMDLRELAENGILKPQDMVWSEGMDEWVKAIQQRGLFADSGEGARRVTAKPPPGRRVRRKEDDEVEDDEDVEDEQTSRQKAKKRKVERAKMNTGLKVGLILGGVACGLLFLGCAGGLMVWLTLRGDPAPKNVPIAVPNPPPKGMPNFPDLQPKGFPNAPPGPAKTQTYTVNNLMPHLGDMPQLDNRRQFNFQQGKRVIITVTNTLTDPKTDVDLYVHPTNNMAQIITADILTPDLNRNCRVEFVVPVTQSYTVRLTNLGPGIANSCVVTIEER
jgi:hypothetical protein